MKEISPFLSPLYIAGVMTPVLAVGCWMAGALPRREASKLDWLMLVYTGILAMNALAVLMLDMSLGALELILKLGMPSVIYFFVRHVIRSYADLLGIVTTFLYGCIVPFGTLLFENLVAPISVQEARGMTRYEGLYSDVVNYSIYAMLAFVCFGYLFILAAQTGRLTRKAIVLFSLGFGMCAMCLLSIHHATSWAVGAAILTMTVLFSLRVGTFLGPIVIAVLAVCGFCFAGGTVSSNVTEVYNTEIEIVQGNQVADRAFHGRVVTWRKYFREWNDFSLLGKSLGVAVTGRKDIMRPMMMRGIHNDYLRIMFSSGILGLVFYLLMLAATFWTSWKLPVSERYLLQTVILVSSLYSVTTLPTTYPSFLYFSMSVIAYAALVGEARIPHRFAEYQDIAYGTVEAAGHGF